MIIFFEISNPFMAKPKFEKVSVLRRFIWGWFSIAYLPGGFNDVAKAIRDDYTERLTNTEEQVKQE